MVWHYSEEKAFRSLVIVFDFDDFVQLIEFFPLILHLYGESNRRRKKKSKVLLSVNWIAWQLYWNKSHRDAYILYYKWTDGQSIFHFLLKSLNVFFFLFFLLFSCLFNHSANYKRKRKNPKKSICPRKWLTVSICVSKSMENHYARYDYLWGDTG